jgi:hypothetical protein
MSRAIFSEAISESFRVHCPNREKVVTHHARDSVWFWLCAQNICLPRLEAALAPRAPDESGV